MGASRILAISLLFKSIYVASALAFNPLAFADYRIFELMIVDMDKGTGPIVQSTLDHLQYPRVYPVKQNEHVRYVDSWRCWGDYSNFRKPCPKPERTPATGPVTE